jgi:hypothetical protein
MDEDLNSQTEPNINSPEINTFYNGQSIERRNKIAKIVRNREGILEQVYAPPNNCTVDKLQI